ncbi:MAG: sigma-70 family RNA polymerase sigma factor [Planctomycetes bacterium]|nr:sigma-70 family RNA polymerase sigma factor [Planctomycetota bacterium]
MPTDPSITALLDAAGERRAGAADELLDAVYLELKRLAQRLMASERRDVSIQATMLVHDAWMSLVGHEEDAPSYERRAHFFGAAARAMRRFLIDHARKRDAVCRGGDHQRVTFCDFAGEVQEPRDASILALHEALEKLEQIAPAAARVVELRYFAGLDLEETALALGRSVATVKREWSYARAWLHERLQREDARA